MTSAHADDDRLGGRLPLLDPSQLDPEQARLREQVTDTRGAVAAEAGFEMVLPDGRLIGPFNSFGYVPAIGQALREWAAAIRGYDLPADAQQVAILAVGAAWRSDYEVYAHTAEARHAGVPETSIQAILAGQPRPGCLRPPTWRTGWPWRWPSSTRSATSSTRRRSRRSAPRS